MGHDPKWEQRGYTGWKSSGLEVLKVIFPGRTVKGCKDLKDQCNLQKTGEDPEHLILRFLCPQTCNCWNPLSGATWKEGCPAGCALVSDVMREIAECQDEDNDGSPVKNWFDGFFSYYNYTRTAWRTPEIHAAMIHINEEWGSLGCAGVGSPLFWNWLEVPIDPCA